jgi:hypothetical protein
MFSWRPVEQGLVSMENFIFNPFDVNVRSPQAERAGAPPPKKPSKNLCPPTSSLATNNREHSDVFSSPARVSAHHPRAEDNAADRMGQPQSPQSRFGSQIALFPSSSALTFFCRIPSANCAESISDHMYRMAVTLMIMPLPPAVDRSKYPHLCVIAYLDVS